MKPRRLVRTWSVLVLLVLPWGCGDGADGGKSAAGPQNPPLRPVDEDYPAAPPSSSGPKRVHFIGFDASAPLVQALEQGKLEGIVVQNPYRMGELGLRTLVEHLEKTEVKPQISTGETL